VAVVVVVVVVVVGLGAAPVPADASGSPGAPNSPDPSASLDSSSSILATSSLSPSSLSVGAAARRLFNASSLAAISLPLSLNRALLSVPAQDPIRLAYSSGVSSRPLHRVAHSSSAAAIVARAPRRSALGLRIERPSASAAAGPTPAHIPCAGVLPESAGGT
jgi:hypothetical protein